MKDYDETTEDVLARVRYYDEHHRGNVIRTAVICAVSACAVCAAAFAGAGLLRPDDAKGPVPVNAAEPADTVAAAPAGTDMQTDDIIEPAETLRADDDIYVIEPGNLSGSGAMDVCKPMLIVRTEKGLYLETRGHSASAYTPDEKIGVVSDYSDFAGGEGISGDSELYSAAGNDRVLLVKKDDGTFGILAAPASITINGTRYYVGATGLDPADYNIRGVMGTFAELGGVSAEFGTLIGADEEIYSVVEDRSKVIARSSEREVVLDVWYDE